MSSRQAGAGVLAGALAGLALLLGGCVTTGPADEPETASSATPSVTALPYAMPSVIDGHFTFTVLDLRCGLTAVFGSHAEGTPQGQFCSARLRVWNDHSEAHTYVAKRQRLVFLGGEAAPDPFAMAVRRQLEEMELGARNVVELEVWWDIPVSARVTGVKVGGDRDPVGFLNSSPVPYVPGGALIPMRPRER